MKLFQTYLIFSKVVSVFVSLSEHGGRHANWCVTSYIWVPPECNTTSESPDDIIYRAAPGRVSGTC